MPWAAVVYGVGRLRPLDDAAQGGGADGRRVFDDEHPAGAIEAMTRYARVGIERGLDAGALAGLEHRARKHEAHAPSNRMRYFN
jgi:hypothetical protein